MIYVSLVEFVIWSKASSFESETVSLNLKKHEVIVNTIRFTHFTLFMNVLSLNATTAKCFHNNLIETTDILIHYLESCLLFNYAKNKIERNAKMYCC